MIYLRPCLQCLHDKPFRKRAAQDGVMKIIQCPASDCGFNVTGYNWEDAVKKWNGFKVWELVDRSLVAR